MNKNMDFIQTSDQRLEHEDEIIQNSKEMEKASLELLDTMRKELSNRDL